MSSGVSCPLDQHYVRDHTRRTKKSGIVPVSGHYRVNPKGKEKLLHASNIRHLYYNRRKISDKWLQKAIDWMRQQNFVPQGHGSKTNSGS